MALRLACPSCGDHIDNPPFYELAAAPTNSCLLINDRDAAVDFPIAPIQLSLCRACGFIFNAAWEPGRTNYSEAYEETQGFSETFNTFQEGLARELIARYHLRGKHIVEIGCGKGEFLNLLCELGENTGVGYDPSFVPSRNDPARARAQFIGEFFTEESGPLVGDFLCCKMTLEHIPDVGNFLRIIRGALDTQEKMGVFFQVPDATRILCDSAFWDIYYEHCSYFTAHTLCSLFERSGFRVQRVWTEYEGQYLMIEARPISEGRIGPSVEQGVIEVEQQVDRFTTNVASAIRTWRDRVTAGAAAGKRIVLWGSGSKAVAFLTTLNIDAEVAAVVDINPFRRGRFMPKTGHLIIGPQDTPELAPELVIVMNPIYVDEIGRTLQAYGCHPEILTV
jgi:hypothetical protein